MAGAADDSRRPCMVFHEDDVEVSGCGTGFLPLPWPTVAVVRVTSGRVYRILGRDTAQPHIRDTIVMVRWYEDSYADLRTVGPAAESRPSPAGTNSLGAPAVD